MISEILFKLENFSSTYVKMSLGSSFWDTISAAVSGVPGHYSCYETALLI